MAWIRTIPFAEAGDELREAMKKLHAMYPPEYDDPVFPRANDDAGVTGAHSLIPDAMFHALATFASLMSPDLPLKREQHEMIATVVSATNDCFY
jgi:hypothetical protein